MPEPMPVVRELFWSAVAPRLCFIAAITIAIHLLRPDFSIVLTAVTVAVGQSIVYANIQRFFTRDHIPGMRSYRARRFEEAIEHFRASHDYFVNHRTFDTYRAWFGVTSKRSYRQIAILNTAYCYAMLGDAAEA